MSRIPSVDPLTQQPVRQTSTDLRDVDVGQFMDLLIAELQNQDPLDPVDNSEMAQQIGQIREISATDKLTDTLSAVLTGQSLTTASSLIGKKVEALSDDGTNVEGVVDRVTVNVDPEDNAVRTYRVHVGGQAFDLDNIRQIESGE